MYLFSPLRVLYTPQRGPVVVVSYGPAPLLRQLGLDTEQISVSFSSKGMNHMTYCLFNYRPIANLSFIFKLTEKIVKKRLLDHLTSNTLLNPFQYAYTKFYSTETTLLSLHDHLSNAISMQQVSCLCFIDLSAAFDTLDHSILLHRLFTWFGISSVSLQWFTSYLSSRTSTVGIPPHILLHPLSPASSTRLRSWPSSFQSLYHSS